MCWLRYLYLLVCAIQAWTSTTGFAEGVPDVMSRAKIASQIHPSKLEKKKLIPVVGKRQSHRHLISKLNMGMHFAGLGKRASAGMKFIGLGKKKSDLRMALASLGKRCSKFDCSTSSVNIVGTANQQEQQLEESKRKWDRSLQHVGLGRRVDPNVALAGLRKRLDATFQLTGLGKKLDPNLQFVNLGERSHKMHVTDLGSQNWLQGETFTGIGSNMTKNTESTRSNQGIMHTRNKRQSFVDEIKTITNGQHIGQIFHSYNRRLVVDPGISLIGLGK